MVSAQPKWCMAMIGPMTGPAPAMDAKLWPNNTIGLLGT